MFLKPPTGLVCLKFSGGRKLWIDSDVLCSLSDYFKTCLSSDFSEGIVHVADTISHDSEDTEPVQKKQKTTEEAEDSDEESDEPLPDQPPVSPSNGTSLPFQEIPISQTSLVTYRALLVWHQTGFIRFAPLTSSFLERHSWKLVFANDSGKNLEMAIKTRKKAIANLVKEDPSLPSPVSAKSIYRLADFLSIPRLKELALRAYSSRLTPQGAVHELLSKDSAFYPEVRKTILDYISRNSQVVINSYGYQIWVQQDPGGGGGGTEDTALVRQLFEALSQSGSRLRKFYGEYRRSPPFSARFDPFVHSLQVLKKTTTRRQSLVPSSLESLLSFDCHASLSSHRILFELHIDTVEVRALSTPSLSLALSLYTLIFPDSFQTFLSSAKSKVYHSSVLNRSLGILLPELRLER